LENFAQNNPIKQTHFDANGAVDETVTITYTYDSNGNPLTRKTVSKATGQAETPKTPFSIIDPISS
jgi:hypothetical protein